MKDLEFILIFILDGRLNEYGSTYTQLLNRHAFAADKSSITAVKEITKLRRCDQVQHE